MLTKNIACEVAFLVRDAGDANNLALVAKALLKQKVSLKIIVLGDAAKGLLSDEELKDHALSLDDFELSTKLADIGGGNAHFKLFKQLNDAKAIVQRLRPKVVVTGGVSHPQGVLAGLYRQSATYIITYLDSLAINKSAPTYSPLAMVELQANLQSAEPIKVDLIDASNFSADKVWVTCESIRQALLGMKMVRPENIEAVGHPQTEIDLQEIKLKQQQIQAIKKQLNLDNRPVVYYPGGRQTGTGNDYEDSFRQFVQAFKRHKADFNLIINLHPQTDGTEVSILEEEGFLAEEIEAMLTKLDYKSLLAIAHVVVSKNSTVASQAALLDDNKLVVFLDTKQDPDVFAVVLAGVANQIRSSQELVLLLQAYKNHFLARLELKQPVLPEQAIVTMVEQIMAKLNPAPNLLEVPCL